MLFNFFVRTIEGLIFHKDNIEESTAYRDHQIFSIIEFIFPKERMIRNDLHSKSAKKKKFGIAASAFHPQLCDLPPFTYF